MQTVTHRLKRPALTILIFLFMQAQVSLAGAADTDIESQATGFYYTIQTGDTLWDLSRRFYSSNWVWPGLWEMNPDIKNPHWIYPGKRIRVFLKGSPEIPAQVSLPASEPTQEVSAAGPEIMPRFSYRGIDGVGFIRRHEAQPLGRILKAKDGNIMMSADDIIFMEPFGSDTLEAGKRYIAFTTREVALRTGKSGYSGIRHTINGIIKVTGIHSGYVTGKITQAFQPVSADDLLMEYTPSLTDLPVRKSIQGLDAQIVCADGIPLLLSDLTVGFINKGLEDGVEPGQIYSIFEQQTPVPSASGSGPIAIEPQEVGKLIVLKTEDIASAVMILQSSAPIREGFLVN